MQTLIEIVPFNNTLTNDIVSLILNIQQNEFNIQITLADQPDLLTIESFYQSNNGNFWCAIDNHSKKLVGTIALIDVGYNFGTIRKMFVRADYRGKEKNIASILLETLENHARLNGLNALYLGTKDVLLAAQAFYVKKGFYLIDESELPAKFPRMVVDNRFFKKEL